MSAVKTSGFDELSLQRTGYTLTVSFLIYLLLPDKFSSGGRAEFSLFNVPCLECGLDSATCRL